MPENQEGKKFSFINEQIKKKPFYKKKWFLHGLAGVGLAMIFGCVAGLSFAAIKPWAEKQFGQPDDPQQIVIMQDDTETETETEIETQMETQSETETETEAEAETETEEITEDDKIEVSDYMNLYKQMYEVASEISDSVVTVTGISNEVDWFNKVIENNVQVSGLIIASNRTHLFVLTEDRAFENTERIVITFPDGSIADATLQKVDRVTNLAVVKLPLESIREETLENAAIATLGNSNNIRQGAPVISVGSPLGYSNSMAFGMITSVTAKSVIDSEYQVITTDMIGNNQGSGILIDLDGNIVGIIAQQFGVNDQSTICALAVSDIKYMIEMLSNSKDITYMGINGTEITDTIAEGMDVPRGIYVREVEMESPAMYANIMADDVLVEVDGEEILTMKDYEKMLRSHNADDIIWIKLKRRGIEEYVDLEISVTLGKY